MKKVILLNLVVLLLTAALAPAATRLVPDEYATIQDAIDACVDGDVVIVALGTYTGPGNRDIGFGGKAITVRSENGPANCIIDCQSSGRGFYFRNEDENSIVDGFTIINGNAYHGGGIYCYGSSPTITNCRITGNEAIWGAGIFCKNSSSPTISNCIISGNVGAGISCSRSSNPLINNCLITGNTRGGIFCYHDSSPMISNCTITENKASWGGGICSQHYSDPTISNCILWGNRANYGDEIALIDQTYPSKITVRYSNVQGGPAGVYASSGCTLNWGQGNINADPMFMDNDGLDNVLCTEDDNLRLFEGSPCIDAGDNSAVPPSLLTDIEGNPRIINGTVDLGAYEGANQGFLLSMKSLTVSEGAIATFTVILAMDPFETIEVTVAVESGDPDIMIESGALLTFDSSNYLLPQTVVLVAAEDADNLNGTAAVWISAPGFVTNGVSATEVDNDEPTSNILFVDASSPGVNNGSSWSEAYTELRDAMSIAAKFPQVEEIRVGQGTYTPAESSGDRTATFQLINGVAIKGGYAGFGQLDPNARDINAYETVLSGDLNGDDIAVADPEDLRDEPSRAENSYKVVTGSGTDETAVLDGFTITAGNANRRRPLEHYQDDGGGIYNYEGSPTITNCVISSNSARDNGGGMYNYKGSPLIINCRVTGNSAGGSGGGMFNSSSSPTITNCAFTGNSADSGGGGMYNAMLSNPTLTNCTFTCNSAFFGGGMTNYWSSPTLNNCTIIDNLASGPGGGMYNAIKSPTVVACMFSGNSSGGYGGGMCNATSSPILTNCAFTNNSAENGGGVYNGEDKGPAGFEPSDPTLTNCTFTGNSARYGGGMFNTDASSPILTNCILWGDTSNEVTDEFGCVTLITYSNVQGGWPGEGNIDADPFFVAPRYWDANGVWVDGDYRLLQDSPCIDAGDPNYIAEPNETDLDGRPRVIGGRIDMGAYEFNHIPIADAGADREVYAWIDGITEVTLDGTGSYDDDGHPLTYNWSWTINGQTYDVNGVTPTIELPVGEQTIELIVNDGIDDSELDEVVITVFEPVESQLRIAPRVINRHSRQPKILALVRLPQGVTADQIDSNEPLLLCPGGIEAMSQRVTESRSRGASIFALFDKAELMDAVSANGSVELQVVGQLKTGQYFGGTDTVRIISPRNND